MKRKAKTAAYIIVAAAILLFLFGWKVPVILKIESLHLPEGCETVYPVKVHVSDVYWLHIKGEKVIKCSLGYEAAKEYIEAHNTLEKLENIRIFPYGGMSDIAIYDAEYDEEFRERADQDCYIKIDYLRKI
ncbi:hypothetical protein D7X98_10755 [bacterium 1XD8-76]|nr:hypothetical protein D7X98_10755 [bacterium 1XD8-76]